MNTLDLLSALPPFRDWSHAEILASPAWAMPCRLGTEEGRIVSEGALLPAAVAMEWPVAEKVADIKTIVNEEHSMIMAREITPEEGIEEMNERVAELFE